MVLKEEYKFDDKYLNQLIDELNNDRQKIINSVKTNNQEIDSIKISKLSQYDRLISICLSFKKVLEKEKKSGY